MTHQEHMGQRLMPRLTCTPLTCMSLGLEPEVLAIGPVDTPGSLSSNLARGGPKSGYRCMVNRSQAESSDKSQRGP